MAWVELVLYSGLTTGRLEVSMTSVAGPWTAFDLPSPMPVRDALANWAAQAAALWGGFWDAQAYLEDEVETPVYIATDLAGQFWLKLTPTLADLLGYPTTIIAASGGPGYWACDTATARPSLGIAYCVAGRTFPHDVESAELEEFRAGRAVAEGYGRALEVDVSLYLRPHKWVELEDSPLLSGHGAFRVTWDNSEDFRGGELDGALTVYPLDTVAIDRESDADHVAVTLRCSMVDP